MKYYHISDTSSMDISHHSGQNYIIISFTLYSFWYIMSILTVHVVYHAESLYMWYIMLSLYMWYIMLSLCTCGISC